MTHDYKDTLYEFTEFAKEQEDGSVYICVTGENYETIYSAIKLAQRAEQVRKERDELALFIRLNHDVVKVPDHIFLMCVRAKKVVGE